LPCDLMLPKLSAHSQPDLLPELRKLQAAALSSIGAILHRDHPSIQALYGTCAVA
jgi:hypothetical protein